MDRIKLTSKVEMFIDVLKLEHLPNREYVKFILP